MTHPQTSLCLAAILAGSALAGPALAQSEGLYRVEPGTQALIDAFGTCRIVEIDDDGGPDVMIPFRSAEEWSEGDIAFLAAPRPRTTVMPCEPSEPPASCDADEIGATCPDGTIYMGVSLDRAARTYATDVTYEVTRAWANETGYGALSFYKSEKNTQKLNGGPSGYCKSLDAHGYNDWFLPSTRDLARLKSVVVPDDETLWWSSTEEEGWPGWAYYLEASQDRSDWRRTAPKDEPMQVRCFRNAEPEFADGDPDPCAETDPMPGEVCKDGTIYAGTETDKLFFTAPRYEVRMDNVDISTFPDVGDYTDGRSNMYDLLEDGVDFAPADYCDGLTANGHDDWYLPNQYEWDEVGYGYFGDDAPGWIHGLGALDPDGHYWTSSDKFFEEGPTYFEGLGAHGGSEYSGSGELVRCMRRNSTPPPNFPW